ncbi:MAG: YdeI/OmpD-associated family protein [Lentimicrobiaceae bacterium]|nr:YdeI/OmpD-associated family protein [Lentimicrobiaceae bacterium]MCB9024514.1 YdeI/OmpD-associated family protein [Lentimicrobiaceae bacterium]MCO5266372.1 YdeI/OmpD-associated family protein [Lentimicrobium sp.]
MKELEHLFFESRESFRLWLETNHEKSPGIWMIFYKKHLKAEGITYHEALEEALCFGWIDSLIKKVNNDQYVRKFTPRTNISNWSDLNKNIVMSLIQRGKMTKAGLEKVDVYLKTGEIDWESRPLKKQSKELDTAIPDFMLKAFAENEPALTNFHQLAPTYQRHYILWITTAKREETVMLRLKESIKLLIENKKLGMK